MAGVAVSTTINGDNVEYLCQPDETLLEVLRDRLGLTGTKEGCGTGDCGACSIILDNRLVCSCLVLGAGLKAGASRPSRAWRMAQVASAAAEIPRARSTPMRICTPGSYGRQGSAGQDPDPTEEESVRPRGNLCRCTGYDKSCGRPGRRQRDEGSVTMNSIRVIRLATSHRSAHVRSARRRRQVTGRARYGADFNMAASWRLILRSLTPTRRSEDRHLEGGEA